MSKAVDRIQLINELELEIESFDSRLAVINTELKAKDVLELEAKFLEKHKQLLERCIISLKAEK